MKNTENLEMRKTLEHIAKAIFYLNQTIAKQEDPKLNYEFDLVRKNLEMSQKILQYGLMQN